MNSGHAFVMQPGFAESISRLPPVPELSIEELHVGDAVCNHVTGLVLAPTLKALAAGGVIGCLRQAPGPLALQHIATRTHANPAYLHVALRLLAALGWLEEHADAQRAAFEYSVTPAGDTALTIGLPAYEQVCAFLPIAARMRDLIAGEDVSEAMPLFRHFLRRMREGWRLPGKGEPRSDGVRGDVQAHLDGVLISPTVVALARVEKLALLESGPLDLAGAHESLRCMFDVLATAGWVIRTGERVELTGRGRFGLRVAWWYGAAVAHIPMLQKLPALLFQGWGSLGAPEERVTDVDREVQRWGEGRSTNAQPRALDLVLRDLFNRPIQEQPMGICQMGCGDGTVLERLAAVVGERTARGQMRDAHPLVLIAVDADPEARRAAARVLRKCHTRRWAVVSGAVTRPALLASALERRGMDIHDLLHVHAFIAHRHSRGSLDGYVPGTRQPRSTGALVWRGAELGSDVVEEALVRRFRRWKPYVSRFGLLVFEKHRSSPDGAARHARRAAMAASAALHGYSDQFPVENAVFVACAREAGLHARMPHESVLNDSEVAPVSVNFFTAP